MRPYSVLIGATLLMTAIGSPGRAQTAEKSEWRPMTFHDLRVPSKTDLLQTLVWPDVIAEANAYVTSELKRPLDGTNAPITALSATYQLGDRTIILSVISTRSCDHGANDRNAEIEPSVCPLRIVVMRAGRVVSTRAESACYADHQDPDLPRTNREDNSYTRLDPATDAIEFRTTVGGRDVARCKRKYSIN